MTAATLPSERPPRRLLKSSRAIGVGFVAVVVLSLGTDQLLHVLKVYPPWGQPMHDFGLNVLALSYRIVYTVFAGWLTARLAPHAPMRHAWILGFIGLFFGTVGLVTTLPMKLGPVWYPIAIAVTALPCTWLGGFLHSRRAFPRSVV